MLEKFKEVFKVKSWLLFIIGIAVIVYGFATINKNNLFLPLMVIGVALVIQSLGKKMKSNY